MWGQFRVHFDWQFWVGILETDELGQLRAARHVFGLSQPKSSCTTSC